MKTAIKKMLSLVLVAMLLVSAVPFQALAADESPVAMYIKLVDANGNVLNEVGPTEININNATAKVEDLIYFHWSKTWADEYDFGHAKLAGTDNDIGLTGEVARGERVNIRLIKKGEPTQKPDEKPEQKPDVQPEVEAEPITLNIKFKEGGDVVQTITRVPKNEKEAPVYDMLTYWYFKNDTWTEKFNVTKAHVSGVGEVDKNATILCGQTVTVVLTEKPTAPTTVEPIKVIVKVNESDNVVWEDTKVPANGEDATVENLLHYVWNTDWDNVYSFHHAWSHNEQKNLKKTDSVKAGDVLYIMLENEEDDKKPSSGTTSGKDRYVDGEGNLHMGYTGNVNKDPYPVILNVYIKNSGNGITYSEDYTITTLASEDSELTITEVRNFLKNYYKSTSSTDGFSVDGIYEYENNFNSAWANDAEKYDVIYNINKARYDGTIRLAVVLKNAKLKTASTADSSNPKTGDTAIYMAVTVMGLSASALAAAYYFNKKRAF